MTFPMTPPSASTSRITFPLAGPPNDGLHGMKATVSRFKVSIDVLAPIRAAATPASHPACPAPITITSYCPASNVIYVHPFRLSVIDLFFYVTLIYRDKIVKRVDQSRHHSLYHRRFHLTTPMSG